MSVFENFRDIFNELDEGEDLAVRYFFDVNYNISKFLVDYRAKNCLTQKQLAKKLNVSQAMISKYENGDYNFSLKKICEIGEALDCRPVLDFALKNSSNLNDNWTIEGKSVEKISLEGKNIWNNLIA